ncbi:MAG TPA: hypothetical protein VK653_10945 [Xanthobacteraceae bacterium]|nr:hypothetical protein [Xanthobacteraceae bacterium]
MERELHARFYSFFDGPGRRKATIDHAVSFPGHPERLTIAAGTRRACSTMGVMKYPWLAVTAILLSAGAADIADAMTYKDIAGLWCGDVTDYVFTPNKLTVKFHDGKPANVFKITKYTYTNDSVRIDWVNGAGKASVTVFAEFIGNTTTMAQQQNGDKPRRPFHRC